MDRPVFRQPLYADLLRVSALSFLLRPFLTMRNAWLNRNEIQEPLYRRRDVRAW